MLSCVCWGPKEPLPVGIDPASTGSADGLEIMGISSVHLHGVLMDISTLLTSDNSPPKTRRKGNREMSSVCAAWRAGHGELGECPVEVWGSLQEVSTKLPLEANVRDTQCWSQRGPGSSGKQKLSHLSHGGNR